MEKEMREGGKLMSVEINLRKMKDAIELNCESMHLNDIHTMITKIEKNKKTYENSLHESKKQKNNNEKIYTETKNERIEKQNTFENKIWPELCEIIKKENQLFLETDNITQNIEKNEKLFNDICNLENMSYDILDVFGEFEQNMNDLTNKIKDRLNKQWDMFEKNWKNWNHKDLCAWMAVQSNTAVSTKQQWKDLELSY